MVTVTESAKGLLKEFLTVHGDDPEMGVRLTSDPQGQPSIVLDKEEPGDLVVEYQGVKALLVASELTPALEEVTLDVEDTDDGPKLVVHRIAEQGDE